MISQGVVLLSTDDVIVVSCEKNVKNICNEMLPNADPVAPAPICRLYHAHPYSFENLFGRIIVILCLEPLRNDAEKNSTIDSGYAGPCDTVIPYDIAVLRTSRRFTFHSPGSKYLLHAIPQSC